jgi:hypothetical protein
LTGWCGEGYNPVRLGNAVDFHELIPIPDRYRKDVCHSRPKTFNNALWGDCQTFESSEKFESLPPLSADEGRKKDFAKVVIQISPTWRTKEVRKLDGWGV